MGNLMKITNAQLISSDKRARISGGVYIHYTSKENAIKGSNIELEFEDTKHYFEITDISINGENLEVKAKEVGYWAKKFDNKSDFDLRKLIGLELSKVDDTETISKIRKMSCWC
jgi:predicted nuclease of restriction endonuclease-like RecB superfamily